LRGAGVGAAEAVGAGLAAVGADVAMRGAVRRTPNTFTRDTKSR
jgi:hypothetical protein